MVPAASSAGVPVTWASVLSTTATFRAAVVGREARGLVPKNRGAARSASEVSPPLPVGRHGRRGPGSAPPLEHPPQPLAAANGWPFSS